MKVKKIVQRGIRTAGNGVNCAGNVSAVVSGNVGEDSSRTRVSSKQRIVQRSAKKSGREDGLAGDDADG